MAAWLALASVGQVSSFSSQLSSLTQRGWSAKKVPPLSFCTRLSVASIPTTTQTSSKLDGSDDEEDSSSSVSVVGTMQDEEEEMLLAELDGDDEEYEIDPAKNEEWMDELRRLARTTSQDPTAVDKAQAVFDDMFEAYVMTEETSMWPGVEVYNLLLEIHAYARSADGAIAAEKLLSRMEDPSVEFIARPNLETYLKVMDAWAMRKDPTKAEEVLRRLEQRYESTGDETIQPTANAYNKLIKAYGMTGNAEMAEEIFVSLLDKDREDPLRANYKSWVQIMKAFASLQDGTEKVRAIFREMLKEYRMGEEDYKPKIDAYNTLIRALGQIYNGSEESEALLFDLLERYRAGEEEVRPNGETFRHVLTAQRRRKNVSGAKVEQLLQIQEGLYASTKEIDLKMDGRLYNVALYAISRSHDSKKAIRARRIVTKMKEIEDEVNHINVRTYFNLLSACAFSDGTPEEKLEAFQIAVDGLKELRESLSQEPDSSCFGMFLKACANLMPESRKRDAVVENVFRKCCTDGLVDEFVLSEFERASSEALQLEVLGGFLADDVRIPEEWSKNVYKEEEV
jgi:pentatricopeptide repeat protein